MLWSVQRGTYNCESRSSGRFGKDADRRRERKVLDDKSFTRDHQKTHVEVEGA
jgi:hypothetical protein